MKLKVPTIGMRYPLSMLSLTAALAFFSQCDLPTLHANFEAVSTKLARVKNLPRQPMLRVLLASEQEGLKIEVNGAYNTYDPYTGKKVEGAFLKSSYYMYPTSDGIKWGQEFPGIYQLLIVPDSSTSSVIVNGIQYPGAVAFYQVENKIAAVNWVSLENLTSSIMSTTFLPADRDYKESLSSYAIAIRSLIYQTLVQSKNPYWDIRAEDAGYKGRAVIRLDQVFTDAMKVSQDIIMATPGGIMKNQNEMQPVYQEIKNLLQIMTRKEVDQLAESGKDARRILEHYFPGNLLTVAESPKIPPEHYYSN